MEKEKPMSRQEILETARAARVQEVLHYQINIDNYTLALKEISELSPSERQELSTFSSQLTELLASEKLEQKKAKIMLSVIEKQVEAD
jgi:hypothetical protein